MNKILIDHCLSPRIAYALDGYYNVKSRKFECVALRDKFAENTPDIVWLNSISHSSDNWAFITNDKLRNDAEKTAVLSSGLVGFVFSNQLAKMKLHTQLTEIFRRIIQIENEIRSHNGLVGRLFEINHTRVGLREI